MVLNDKFVSMIFENRSILDLTRFKTIDLLIIKDMVWIKDLIIIVKDMLLL